MLVAAVARCLEVGVGEVGVAAAAAGAGAEGGAGRARQGTQTAQQQQQQGVTMRQVMVWGQQGPRIVPSSLAVLLASAAGAAQA
jgi:hypothetical protein